MNLDRVHVERDADKFESGGHGAPNMEALGSYNRLDFVVRLRPDLHQVLEAEGGTLGMRSSGSWEVAQAFSTYLHETIHWWQHCGTPAGLMLSFVQPAHAHMNRERLKEVTARHGTVKPLIALSDLLLGDDGKQDGSLNVVLNNWHDLENFRKLVINPVKLVQDVASHPYFECVGHSYRMAISATNWLISATLDPRYDVLPDPRTWEAEMSKLEKQKTNGFYYGSPIEVPPLGATEIFEGQARFSQLQYLHGASAGRLTWNDARARGLLTGVYVSAFNVFLDAADEEWPTSIDDPVVGLFLLVCDLALSPTEGLFLPITHPASLIWSTDPGWRFLFLSATCKQEGADFKRSIQTYSAEEYWTVSERLSQLILSPSPKELAEAISSYAQRQPNWAGLMDEDNTFDFEPGNLPIRVLLARFTRYQIDKLKAPQFFCWPGMCLTSYRQPIDSDTAASLFIEHQALFLNKADLDVYPRAVPGIDEATLQRLIDDFYHWVATYEMTRQWLVEDGPFDYDYGWLTSKFSFDEVKHWVDSAFEKSAGAHPDSFTVLR